MAPSWASSTSLPGVMLAANPISTRRLGTEPAADGEGARRSLRLSGGGRMNLDASWRLRGVQVHDRASRVHDGASRFMTGPPGS
ncbi:unnamed protein product [Boreogadus saida]